MIEVKGLQKTFSHPSGELHVLKGIDLAIKEGEMTAVVGASGVGKSTLLHILGTLDRPTAGKIYYDGVDVFGLHEKELTAFRNKRIGFVFQFHHLLPEFTAIENVFMPGLLARETDYERMEKRAASLLEELGLKGRMRHKPGELSGGEQQRVAVARALFMSPAVVLADEPTGNLDMETGRELFELLFRLNSEKGITFLIATHDKEISGRCRRVLEMVGGHIKSTFNGRAKDVPA